MKEGPLSGMWVERHVMTTELLETQAEDPPYSTPERKHWQKEVSVHWFIPQCLHLLAFDLKNSVVEGLFHHQLSTH